MIHMARLPAGGEEGPLPVEVKALNRIAAALERLADVYLYVNDPEGEEGGEGQSLSDLPEDHPSFKDGSAWGVQRTRGLPDGFRGMR